MLNDVQEMWCVIVDIAHSLRMDFIRVHYIRGFECSFAVSSSMLVSVTICSANISLHFSWTWVYFLLLVLSKVAESFSILFSKKFRILALCN